LKVAIQETVVVFQHKGETHLSLDENNRCSTWNIGLKEQERIFFQDIILVINFNYLVDDLIFKGVLYRCTLLKMF
jgi:hypothetical protein